MASSETLSTVRATLDATLSRDVHSAALSAAVSAYVTTTLEEADAPFYVGTLEFAGDQWSYVLHSKGLDLFRIGSADEMSVDIERKSFPPLHGADFLEDTTAFITGGFARRVCIRHALLGSAELTIHRPPTPLLDLLRGWARTSRSVLEFPNLDAPLVAGDRS
ncbi:MAG: hypothetical protein QOD50_512 [Actinomycetota bacterium]|nr:hypothetical protein [Actinomycetota bacterium]